MASMRPADRAFLEKLFGMESGYVLNFNNGTFDQFFAYFFDVAILTPKYERFGTSKANRLRSFFATEDERTVAKALRGLWEHRQSILTENEIAEQDQTDKDRYFAIVRVLEGAPGTPRTDAIEKFADNETLEELVAAINRDAEANRPAASLDRLHTYCMKKFAHSLDRRGIAFIKDDPLETRASRYIKALQDEGLVREISLRIMRSSLSIFASFNTIRNTESLAHDNEIVDKVEAPFIFDSIVNILRFMRDYEVNRSGN